MKFTKKGDLEFTNKELAKQKIREILDRPPKCPKCGGDLPRYPFYDERYEYYNCPNCDYVKKIKQYGVR